MKNTLRMTLTINNQDQKLILEVKIKDYPNHAHLQLLQVPTTKSRAKVLTVVSKTSVLSNLSRENKVSTTTIKIPKGKMKPFRLNQETQVLSTKITLGSIRVILLLA